MSSVDAHVHVFSPKTHPFSAERSYTPGPATVEMLEAHLGRIGASRVVVVQPSPYGDDNRATLQAVRELGAARARAVAVVDPAEAVGGLIPALARRGVRGLRLNFKTNAVSAADDGLRQLGALDRLLAGTDLALEIFAPLALLLELRPALAGLGRPVILDHFAGLKTDSPTLEADLDALTDLLAASNTVLKISGACRATNYAAATGELDAIAPALIRAARGRVIWGSDWPHTGKSADRAKRPVGEIEPFQTIDDRKSLLDVRRWAGSDAVFREIMWDTPGALFGF